MIKRVKWKCDEINIKIDFVSPPLLLSYSLHLQFASIIHITNIINAIINSVANKPNKPIIIAVAIVAVATPTANAITPRIIVPIIPASKQLPLPHIHLATLPLPKAPTKTSKTKNIKLKRRKKWITNSTKKLLPVCAWTL